MANILDYLTWRGDVPFSTSPFNEVDNLIFCELAFIDLSGAVSSRVADGGMVLHEAVEYFFRQHPDDNESMGLIVPAAIRPLLRRLAECPRYRDLILSGFVNTIDEDATEQFSALTVQITPGLAYVTFRGTDDTIVGWIENFHMSFMEAIPAQRDAAEYLNMVAADLPLADLIVGGHSKGGNLAIYAALHCEEPVRSRIQRVYSNDGPGYRREVVDSPVWREMRDRIVRIIPQASVIGRLLEHDDQYLAVKSTASGLWQHDGFSWEVEGTAFLPAEALSEESERIDQSVKKWVAEMSPEECEKFVDALYAVLTASNAKTLTDLTRDRNWLWKLMTNSDISDSRKTVISALSRLTGEAGKLWIESVLPFLKNKKAAETLTEGMEPPAERSPAQEPASAAEPVMQTPVPRAAKPSVMLCPAGRARARAHKAAKAIRPKHCINDRRVEEMPGWLRSLCYFFGPEEPVRHRPLKCKRSKK